MNEVRCLFFIRKLFYTNNKIALWHINRILSNAIKALENILQNNVSFKTILALC